MTLYWVSSIKKPWSYSLIFKKILEYRLILGKKVTSDMPQVFKNDQVAVTFHAGSNAQKFSLIRPHRLWETGVYKTLLIRLPMPLSRYGRKPWFKIRINLQVNRARVRCLRKQHHALHFIFLSLLIFILMLFFFARLNRFLYSWVFKCQIPPGRFYVVICGFLLYSMMRGSWWFR